MKRGRIVILICVAAAVVAAGLLAWRHFAARGKAGYQTTEVTRGDVESTVSSTGSLRAVTAVTIGAQVSANVDTIYVDFNDRVRPGQVLARLDTTVVAAAVLDARSGVMRSRAQLTQAEGEFKRNKPLFESGYLSETEFTTIKTTYEAALASYRSAEATLARAKRNLEYTVILSPIDGTVIERNIEVGQTITSGFQTPTLFVIAKDLAKMEIDVNVDESDIGQIKNGLPVRFTVQAYPDDTFEGVVKQVRLKSTVVQNVVNYTVVVEASNDRGLLLPGMTATVDFIIESRKDVLLVPVSATQYRPDASMMKALAENRRSHDGPPRGGAAAVDSATGPGPAGDSAARGAAAADTARSRRPRRGGERVGFAGHSSGGSGTFGGESAGSRSLAGAGARGSWGGAEPSHVIYLDDKGKPHMAFFVPGVSDGKNMEVVSSRTIAEGMKVVTGAARASAKRGNGENNRTNPFMPTPPRPGGRH